MDIAPNAPWNLGEQLLAIKTRLQPAHRLLRRLQRAGAQVLTALRPNPQVPRTPGQTADLLEVASGRFGVDPHYLNAGAAIEIKIGQGAKPGIGGHLPGEKINEEVSRTRMIPQGTDAISPAPHHDIYSSEDLRQLIFSLKEATRYTKPVSVKTLLKSLTVRSMRRSGLSVP